MDFSKWKQKKNETSLYGFQYEFSIAFVANVKWFSFGFLSLWKQNRKKAKSKILKLYICL